MSDSIKIALIAAITVVLTAILVLYFSPYQQCVRARSFQSETYRGPYASANPSEDERLAKIWCAKNARD